MTRSGLALATTLLLGLAAPWARGADCPVLDPLTRKCQEAVAGGGLVYTKVKLKAAQACLLKIQSGALGGDPATVCRGTPSVPPTDADTAEKFAAAESKLALRVQTDCTDTQVAQLDLCATTVAGLVTCLAADHWQRVDDALEAAFGTVAPSGNAGEQACQKTIADQSRRYLKKRLSVTQRCLNKRNKKLCGTTSELARCLAAQADGPSAERRVAESMAKAENNLRLAIDTACTDVQVAALDACGDDRTSVADCVLCADGTGVELALVAEYQAVRLANPGTTIQTVANAANAGDTILLQPGTYSEVVGLKDSGLSVVGQKTCDTGARAVLTNPAPGSSPNGINSCGSLLPGCADVADDLLLQGFEVRDFDVNDVLTVGTEGVTYRDMVTTGPGTPTDTEYGLFPILSNDVLIEDCLVVGVRDAGIYVGQSTNIVIRNNEVHGNVAGIEVENSANAEVYGNHAHDNSGGILVFKLPGLPVQLSNCHDIHDNLIENNNLPNFGSGTVGLVPRGTGIIALSTDSTMFRNNTITGNDTFGIAHTDQIVLNLLFDPDPFAPASPESAAEENFIVSNLFGSNGANPDSAVAAFAADITSVTVGGGGHCQSGNTFTTIVEVPALATTCPPAPSGCPLVPETTTTTTVSVSTTTSTLGPSWEAIHSTVIGPTCAGCHGSGGGLGGLSDCDLAWTNLVNVPSTELPTMDRVEPLDSTNSWLMHKLDGTQNTFTCPATCGVQMPAGGPPLDVGVRDAIRTWIDNGAVNDCLW